ncbi:hypothetical protein N3K66_002552 [Trichothecium roseum]|uniref:Uncharacterized protein n=1 Tax=Trichothecium roseum TaxID=47278 RepID=A0ACC0VBW5_9HYPO|nr:hypothetical protein N3K66_002552 [Trichothecium roseum]
MTRFPETDEDVAVAISMQFLAEKIFEPSLYGAVPQYSEILQVIIRSMGDYCSPIRDDYSTRAWSAEAWSAILAHPDYMTVRENQCKVLADNLFDRIAILCPQDKAEAFKGDLLEKCIKPAVALCEKFHTSLHKFHLKGSSLLFFGHGKKVRYLENFYASPDDMICINVLQNRKTLHLPKESSAHDGRALQRQVHPVGAVLPALYLQKAQRNENDPQEPIVVCKQKALVAYGLSAEWKRYKDAAERTLASKLLAIRIGI